MKRLSAISCCMLIAALLLLVGTASATTYIWDGSSGTGWNTNANWVGGARPPSGGNHYVILTGAGNHPTNQNRANPLSISCLTFDSTSTTAFTVGGNPITLTDGTAAPALIVASEAAGHTISINMNLGATQTWEIDSSNNNPFTVSGIISDGVATYGITKTGTGTLISSGANAYNGATIINAGELRFNGVSTGSSAKSVNGGTLSGTGTIHGAVTVANTASSKLRGGTGSGSTGTLTINGGLTFSGSSSALDVTSDGTSGLSKVSVGTNTITESSGMTVNLLNPMPTGTYTLISKTSAGLPTRLPTLGINNSGRTAVFAWVSGTGLTVTLYPAPVVTGVSPNTGNIAGGDSVTITGSGFYGGGSSGAVTAVHFGTTAATTYTVTSDTSITVTSPAHAAGTVDVTVTTPYGTSATSSADQFTYVVSAVSISLNNPTTTLSLDPENSPTIDSTLVATVSSTDPEWTVTVKDSGLVANPDGYLCEYRISPAGYVGSGACLDSHLGLAGTTVPGKATASGTDVGPITNTGVLLYTGTAAVTNQPLANTFTQPVAITDSVLPSGFTYRIDLTYTIMAA